MPVLENNPNASYDELPLSVTDLDRLPQYLTPSEFRAVVRLSRAKVYAMCQGGEIPGLLRFGKTIRIPKSSINSFRG